MTKSTPPGLHRLDRRAIRLTALAKNNPVAREKILYKFVDLMKIILNHWEAPVEESLPNSEEAKRLLGKMYTLTRRTATIGGPMESLEDRVPVFTFYDPTYPEAFVTMQKKVANVLTDIPKEDAPARAAVAAWKAAALLNVVAVKDHLEPYAHAAIEEAVYYASAIVDEDVIWTLLHPDTVQKGEQG